MATSDPTSQPQTWTSCPLGEIDPGLLEQGEVHFRLVPLIQPLRVIEELAMLLTPDESERAARFHFDRDRNRFIVARGSLRQMLGHYVGAPADSIRFSYGPFGKPYLAAGAGQRKLEFSLSHSGDWALAGFALGRGIGVDLEQVRTMDDYRGVAESTFAPVETRALLALPEAQHIDGFFNCWTRKEAYAKALGQGLSVDLLSYIVSVEPSAGVDVIPASQIAKVHQVWSIGAPDGYRAAAALEDMERPKMRLTVQPPDVA